MTDELQQIKYLAGITNKPNWTVYEGNNISYTGSEKAELMRKHNIRPGDQAWFKLWFSLPKLTGEKPI
jgi:hypothetical protein